MKRSVRVIDTDDDVLLDAKRSRSSHGNSNRQATSSSSHSKKKTKTPPPPPLPPPPSILLPPPPLRRIIPPSTHYTYAEPDPCAVLSLDDVLCFSTDEDPDDAAARFAEKVRWCLESTDGPGYAVIPNVLTPEQGRELADDIAHTFEVATANLPQPFVAADPTTHNSLRTSVHMMRGQMDALGVCGNSAPVMKARLACMPIWNLVFEGQSVVGALESVAYAPPGVHIAADTKWPHIDIDLNRHKGPIVNPTYRSPTYNAKQIVGPYAVGWDVHAHRTTVTSAGIRNGVQSPTTKSPPPPTDQIQGLLNVHRVVEGGATFACVPGSHRYIRPLMEKQQRTVQSYQSNKDFGMLDFETYVQLTAAMEEAGEPAHPVALLLPAGCMLLWGSWLVHQGVNRKEMSKKQPSTLSSLERQEEEEKEKEEKDCGRLVFYTSAVPTAWASAKGLREMSIRFWKNRQTNHRGFGPVRPSVLARRFDAVNGKIIPVQIGHHGVMMLPPELVERPPMSPEELRTEVIPFVQHSALFKHAFRDDDDDGDETDCAKTMIEPKVYAEICRYLTGREHLETLFSTKLLDDKTVAHYMFMRARFPSIY